MASDDFNRADGNLTSPWGSSTGWAGLRVVSNQVGNAAGSDGDSAMRYTSALQRSIVEYRSGTTDGGPALLDASGNGYVLTAFDGVNAYMYEVTAGPNYNQMGANVADVWAVGNLLEMVIEGNDVVYKKNSVEIMRRTNTTFRTGVVGGIFPYAGNLRFDNFSDGAAADTLFAQVLT